nr:hypothetical protein [Tanacetum cinerariifolium]
MLPSGYLCRPSNGEYIVDHMNFKWLCGFLLHHYFCRQQGSKEVLSAIVLVLRRQESIECWCIGTWKMGHWLKMGLACDFSGITDLLHVLKCFPICNNGGEDLAASIGEDLAASIGLLSDCE